MNGPHEFWTDKLSDWLEGELPDRGAAAVQEHLDACEACARVAEELAEVRRQAHALTVSVPAVDLWPAIQADLGRDPLADEVIDLTRHMDGYPERAPEARLVKPGIFLGIPQLVAAALVLLLGGWAFGAMMPGAAARATTSDPIATLPFVQASQALGTPEMSTRLSALESQVVSRRDELPPRVLEVLNRNLALIDRAIAESLAALEEAPEATYLRSHLEAALERREAALTSTVRILNRGE